jgi:hypothetical protein
MGFPTVTIVTSDFVKLANATALAERAPDLCTVVVPHPLGMIPATEVNRKAEAAFPEIINRISRWQPHRWSAIAKEAYPADRFELKGTLETVNQVFLEKGWSLGLPLAPPTPESVANMLQGTSRQADEVVGRVPPSMGTLTVELVAVNAVMAGCRPEYMPVLMASLEALLDPAVNWRGALTTTGTTQSIVILSGPVIKELGIAFAQGAAGKGHHPNAAIGYAINLIAFNVGGSKPPALDKSTLGSPADIVCWVFGENESRLPPGWKPLQVERGFRESDSVVTAMASYPPLDNLDHWSATPEEHLRWWKYLVSPLVGGAGPSQAHSLELNPIIALGPEHAQLIASAGWSKADFARSFWQNTRIPLSAWPSGCPDMKMLANMLGPLKADSLIPITCKPEQLVVLVAGGAGKHSHYFAPFIGSAPSSRLIVK